MDTNNSRTSIENLIVAGLGQRYKQVFNIPLLVTNAVNKKQAFVALQKNNTDLKLPFAVASYSEHSITEQGSYAASPLLRRGLHGSATNDNVQTYRLGLLPVTTSFQLTVLVASLEEANLFAKRWLMSAVEGSLKFTVKYGIADVDIHIDLDRSVAIPQKTDGVDSPSELEVTTNFRVNGYMSKELERVQAATEVEVSGIVVDKGDMAAAVAEGGRGRTEVFKFNKPWNNT